MNRRAFNIGCAVVAAQLPWGNAARAQPRAHPHVIGYLGLVSRAKSGIYPDEVKKGLEGLGYVEGKDFVIKELWADGRVENLPELARQLVALKPGVILASTTPGIQAVREATSTIPIVMTNVADPVRAGFVESLARPGGNVTGVSHMSSEVITKAVELLRAIVPRANRIAVLRTDNPVFDWYVERIEQVAASTGMKVIPMTANSPEGIKSAFAAMQRVAVQGLIVLSDPMILSQRTQIAELALEAKLPAVYQFREHAEAGGLLSLGANMLGLHVQAAGYVDKILRGAKPRELPVQQPTKLEMVVNLKAAHALGITVPREILLRADSIIE